MREIIQIQLGQCGNQIGHTFWDEISKEHGIGYDGYYIDDGEGDYELKSNQLKRVDIFYNECKNGRYIPRSLLIDTEPGSLDTIKSLNIGKLFKPDNFIHSDCGAGNSFGNGFYVQGEEIIDSILDTIRKEVEQTDHFQGFQLNHSIGGGTGSGLTSLLLLKLREEYPDRLLSTFTVLPSPKVSISVVEPYNAVLAINYLIEYTDQVICIDNEALYNICNNKLKIGKPNYNQLNEIISNVMSGITSSLRFPIGQLNNDLRKLSLNLTPFTRLHFFLPSFTPLQPLNTTNQFKHTSYTLFNELFEQSNMLVHCDPGNGKCLTASVIFRGNQVSSMEIDEQMSSISNRNSNQFIEWIPNNIKSTICSIPIKQYDQCAILLSNNTCIQDVFKRIGDCFDIMFRRKAFLYGLTMNCKLEEMEFTEAQSNLNDLIDEYQQYSNDYFDEINDIE